VSQKGTVTALLEEVRLGDRSALDRLFPLVYDELLAAARVQRRKQPAADTLNTTALAHEAFLKLFGARGRDLNDRAHFMAVAAMAMRQILVDHARRKTRLKHGAGRARVTFDDVEHALRNEPGFVPAKAEALLALDRALAQLHQRSERQSRVVECRFFGGMSIEETAAALGISPATVKRDWSMAQAWLHREIQRYVE
jgi:RNA polymerase sigma factor (TIGR02999 family)